MLLRLYSLGLVAVVAVLWPVFSQAQDNLSFKGVIFSDYNYLVSSPDESLKGDNGFGFRRYRLTTDFDISDKFDGRLRIEGDDGQTTDQGKPAPFVKDLYLRWNDALGEGHRIQFGLFRPALWGASEDQWGYRALEKTIRDRVGIASSRDIGIGVDGPINSDGSLTYHLTVGNNSGGKKETNKYKRVYGTVTYEVNDDLEVSAGSDYYTFDGGSTLNWSAFAGYSMERARIGAEGFYSARSFDDDDDEDTRFGFSLYANTDISGDYRLVLRYDRSERDNLGADSYSDWFVVGFAYLADKNVQIIPNVVYEKHDADDNAELMARLTLWAKF